MHSQNGQHTATEKAAQTHRYQWVEIKREPQQAQHISAICGSQGEPSSEQGQSYSKQPLHVTTQRLTDSFLRPLNEIVRGSASSDADIHKGPCIGVLLQNVQIKRDKQEIDEDVRLLASEDGKKLSSKERRQLRNKISARAFRTRRRRYILQLEEEVLRKTKESKSLYDDNCSLVQELRRYHNLVETLRGHPTLAPCIRIMIEDLCGIRVPREHLQKQQ